MADFEFVLFSGAVTTDVASSKLIKVPQNYITLDHIFLTLKVLKDFQAAGAAELQVKLELFETNPVGANKEQFFLTNNADSSRIGLSELKRDNIISQKVAWKNQYQFSRVYLGVTTGPFTAGECVIGWTINQPQSELNKIKVKNRNIQNV